MSIPKETKVSTIDQLRTTREQFLVANALIAAVTAVRTLYTTNGSSLDPVAPIDADPNCLKKIACTVAHFAGSDYDEREKVLTCAVGILITAIKAAEDGGVTLDPVAPEGADTREPDKYDHMGEPELRAAVEAYGWPWRYVWDADYYIGQENDVDPEAGDTPFDPNATPTCDDLDDVRDWLRRRDVTPRAEDMHTMLSLVDVEVPIHELAVLSHADRLRVVDWTAGVQLQASDNHGVFVPPKPEFLSRYGSAEKGGVVVVYRPKDPAKALTDYMVVTAFEGLDLPAPGNTDRYGLAGTSLANATVFQNEKDARGFIEANPAPITDAHLEPMTAWTYVTSDCVRHEDLFSPNYQDGGYLYLDTVEAVEAELNAYRGDQVDVIKGMAGNRGLDPEKLTLHEVKALIVEEAEFSIEASHREPHADAAAAARTYGNDMMAIAAKIPAVLVTKGSYSPDPNRNKWFDYLTKMKLGEVRTFDGLEVNRFEDDAWYVADRGPFDVQGTIRDLSRLGVVPPPEC